MAEKDQEHLRIRLGARLLKKLDAARGSRTRTDEIERRLEQSFAADAITGSMFTSGPGSPPPPSELLRLITLALALAPKGANRGPAMQFAIATICEAFFANGLSDERNLELYRQAIVSDEPGAEPGFIVAVSILRSAGLASTVSLAADDPELHNRRVIKALMKGAKR